MIEINYHELSKFVHHLKKNPAFYKSITELSTTDTGPLVSNENRLLSGDNFCKECRNYSGISNHCSADAILDDPTEQNIKFFFIEFKNINIGISEEKLEDIRTQLKLKGLETIFCIMPHLVNKYGNRAGNEEIIIKQFYNSPKTFFLVTDYIKTNINKDRKNFKKEDFDLYRLKPFPFEDIEILTVEAFEQFIIEYFET